MRYYTFIFLFFLSKIAFSSPIEVELIKIVDGDTIKINYNNEIQNIRLARIDCLETYNNKRVKKQQQLFNLTVEEIIHIGNKSKEYLINLLTDQKIYIDIIDIGYYKRLIVELYLYDTEKGFINVNNELLLNGHCELYK